MQTEWTSVRMSHVKLLVDCFEVGSGEVGQGTFQGSTPRNANLASRYFNQKQEVVSVMQAEVLCIAITSRLLYAILIFKNW